MLWGFPGNGHAVVGERVYDVRTYGGAVSIDSEFGKTERLSLRASTRDKAVIADAASALEASLTDFIIESAMLRAEQVLADRRHFTLNTAQWQEFMELLDRPAESKPKLAAALQEPWPFSDDV